MTKAPVATHDGEKERRLALLLAASGVRNTVDGYHAAWKISDPEMAAFNKGRQQTHMAPRILFYLRFDGARPLVVHAPERLGSAGARPQIHVGCA